MSAKDGIRMICDIASSEDVLINGLAVFVDDDSIVDNQAGDCREFIIWASADTNDHNICWNNGTVIANNAFDPPLSFKAGDGSAKLQVDALLFMNLSEKSAHLGCYNAVHYGTLSLDHGDVATAAAGSGGYLQTDITASDDD